MPISDHKRYTNSSKCTYFARSPAQWIWFEEPLIVTFLLRQYRVQHGESSDAAQIRRLVCSSRVDAVVGAELALLLHPRWIGTGKWLVQELQAAVDVPPAARLVRWASDAPPSTDELIAITENVLDEAGGCPQVGHLQGTLAVE